MGAHWWPQQKLRPGGEQALLVQNRSFSRLWGAQVLSQIAQNLLNFALIIRVFELAQGTRFANISVAMVILAFGIPSIFFAAAAGVYVDHWNRKYVLIIANALRAFLVLGYLLFEHNLVLLLLLSFAISSVTQFFAPAESASIPALVSKNQLLRANSLFIFTMYASFIIGYAGSAPVIASFGPSGPYILTSGMFLAATFLVSGLPSMQALNRKHVAFRQLILTTGSEIARNWQIIRDDHRLSFPIAQLTITQALVGVILALAPALSMAVLRTPIQNASHVLIIPAGIGMILGILLVGRVAGKRPKVEVISIGLVVAGAVLLLLGLSGQFHRTVHGEELATLKQIGWYVATLVLVLGFTNALISALAQTQLQEATTDETRGKVFGALNMMVNIAATAPIFLAGLLADVFSVTKVIMFVGVCLLVFAVAQYSFVMMRARQKSV